MSRFYRSTFNPVDYKLRKESLRQSKKNREMAKKLAMMKFALNVINTYMQGRGRGAQPVNQQQMQQPAIQDAPVMDYSQMNIEAPAHYAGADFVGGAGGYFGNDIYLTP